MATFSINVDSRVLPTRKDKTMVTSTPWTQTTRAGLRRAVPRPSRSSFGKAGFSGLTRSMISGSERCGSKKNGNSDQSLEAGNSLGTIYPRIVQSGNGGSLVQSGNGQSKLRVAVDVDEVLARFLLTLNAFCAEEHSMHYEVSDYDVYDFKTIWECSQQHSNELVHEFFDSRHFREEVPVIPGAESALRRLKSECELVVVTSRQHVIQEPTLDWLHDHFPGVFEEVHFGNHFALEGKSKKKSEICREINADVLIDDNPGYAMDCAEAGIQVLLFDWDLQYPWSKTEGNGPTHPNITRVADWDQVEVVLKSLANEHSATSTAA